MKSPAPPVIVKVCGITRLEDARLAAQLGATHLGFVLAESQRQVDVDRAAAIAAALSAPRPRLVGVFVDAEAAAIRRAVERIGLDLVQLHGSEPLDFARTLGLGPGRVVRMLRPEQLEQARAWGALDETAALLIEPGREARAGFDWATLRAFSPGKPWLIAGGLEPSTVRAALAASGASGADVASGVESAPGQKDPGKLRAFLAEARAARQDARGLTDGS